MENAVIRACQMEARRVTETLLMIDTYKVKYRKNMPALDLVEENTEKFIKELYAIVWIGNRWNKSPWNDFIINHFRRMTKTPFLFANYIAYASYFLIENVSDSYACFIDIMSLVVHICDFCSKQGHEKFKHTWLELICAIFDKELCIKFIEQGNWNRFHKYLENEENFKMLYELLEETKNEIGVKLLPKLESFHKKSTKPYVINSAVLKDITKLQVENHKKSVHFANSVKDKIEKVCRMSLEDLLNGFQETETQAEDLFCEIDGGAFSGMVGCEEQFSLQKIQAKSSKNFYTTMTLENIENRTKDYNPFENKNKESIKDQDFIPDSDPMPKLQNIIKAKALLREMMEDIANISELVKFVFEEKETDIRYKL